MGVSPSIAGRTIGEGSPCFVIAEAGVNHNGDVGLALELISAAAGTGADAVKFQAFKSDLLASPFADRAPYQRRPGESGSQLEMLKALELGSEAWSRLFRAAAEHRILLLASVFDESSADMLVQLGIPAIKVPSGELTNLALLRHLAEKGKPLIVSTGMASAVEVGVAVAEVSSAGNTQLILLHCVSSYPADPADANLRAMETMRIAHDVPVGFSDHTVGAEVALAAVALGASVIEKHLTLSRDLPGPDHPASMEPSELQTLVRSIRSVESSLGSGRKEPRPSEMEVARSARRSLVAATDLSPGQRLTGEDIAFRRPGTGLPPSEKVNLLGRTLRVAARTGEPLDWDMVE